MSEEAKKSVWKNIDDFTHSKWVKIGIPLLITTAIAIKKNLVTGLIFLCFFVTVFCLVKILGKSIEIATKALPKDLDPNTKDTIQNCIGATLTLGSFAIAGIIIRGENIASRFVHEQIPIGMSIGIIDPIFAVICIGVIWIYTILQVFE